MLPELDGTEQVSEAIDGWYAIAEDLTLKMQPNSWTPLTVTVLDAEGTVLAEYADGEPTPDGASGERRH